MADPRTGSPSTPQPLPPATALQLGEPHRGARVPACCGARCGHRLPTRGRSNSADHIPNAESHSCPHVPAHDMHARRPPTRFPTPGSTSCTRRGALSSLGYTARSRRAIMRRRIWAPRQRFLDPTFSSSITDLPDNSALAQWIHWISFTLNNNSRKET